MEARELVQLCRANEASFQIHVGEFVDGFRRATVEERARMVVGAPVGTDRFAGLVAAVVSALAREVEMTVPTWVASTGSPEPFFAFSAKSYALRVRLMLESPPAFRCRNVFVPENYLDRA